MSSSQMPGRTPRSHSIPKTHSLGSSERQVFALGLEPWWSAKSKGMEALLDYLRVNPCLVADQVVRLFHGRVGRGDVRELVRNHFLAAKQWRGDKVYWVRGHQGLLVPGSFPGTGWDPVFGPVVLRRVAEDLELRQKCEEVRILLGWDVVDWMYEFLTPQEVPQSWSNEAGQIGSGLVYAKHPDGSHEIVVSVRRSSKFAEASAKALLNELGPLLLWLSGGEGLGRVILTLAWDIAGNRDPYHGWTTQVRKQFKEILDHGVAAFSVPLGRVIPMANLVLGEVAVGVQRDGGSSCKLWVSSGGHRFVEVGGAWLKSPPE